MKILCFSCLLFRFTEFIFLLKLYGLAYIQFYIICMFSPGINMGQKVDCSPFSGEIKRRYKAIWERDRSIGQHHQFMPESDKTSQIFIQMEYEAIILPSSKISRMDRDNKHFSGSWNNFVEKTHDAGRWPAAVNIFPADANSLGFWLALSVSCIQVPGSLSALTRFSEPEPWPWGQLFHVNWLNLLGRVAELPLLSSRMFQEKFDGAFG
jgi:hypothetical protein